MNDKAEEQQPAKQYLASASPGQRLRHAREAAGLSRGEVALQMRINERKVAALEEDNYELFPSETFVSGFLRSYAKVLGLPEGDFIRPVSSTLLPPELTPASGDKKQASSMDLPVRMVTYLIIVAVIASLAMWWVSQRQQGSENPAEQPEEIMQQETNQEAMPQQASEAGGETATEESVVDSNAAADTILPTDAVNDEKLALPEESSVSAVSPAEAPAQNTSLDPAAPPLLVEPAIKTEAASTVAPLTDDIPQSKLVLEYQNNSWCEITDKAGRQIVYGLMRAGQTIEIKGEAPFKVFLGYAEGVTIYYNGALFDHSAFRRGELARFRIGQAEHNQPGLR